MIDVQRPEDLIPTVKPAYGAETARVVLDIVRQFPEHHLQNFFEMPEYTRRVLYPEQHRLNSKIADKCGTTRCVAGWAQFVHLGLWNGDEYEAARMLGIHDEDEADHLFFHCMNEDKALGALEYLAKGDPIDWPKLNEVYG
jgi:hypothetical protein